MSASNGDGRDVAPAGLGALSEMEQIRDRLIEIVSGRTGYPPNMLDVNLNLEADLGIDSIKHLEIIAVLQQSSPQALQEKIQECIETLVRTKTLGGIVELLTSAEEGPIGEKSDGFGDNGQQDRPADHGQSAIKRRKQELNKTAEVSRFLLKLDRAPAGISAHFIATNSILMITDDELGVAPALAAELERRGGRPVIVRQANAVSKLSDNIYAADLTDSQQVCALLELVRRHNGPLDALIHLLPLSPGQKFEEMEIEEFEARARVEVNSLLYLAQAAAVDLKQSSNIQGHKLLAASWFGCERFQPGQRGPRSSVLSAGVSGLVKTMALEWPDVGCKVVRLDLNEPVESLASQLVQEMGVEAREREITYKGAERYVKRSERAPLLSAEPRGPIVDDSSVILITGGARGITAATAMDMAERYRPTLLLVGRSPLPLVEESAETAELITPKEIKAVLIEQLRRSGVSPGPAQVESNYVRLIRDREIRRNIAAIREFGGRIEYHQVDVRDGRAFETLIKDIYAKYGRLDGVIHGAGVIEDKLIEEKSPDSFDRVFSTKVSSAFVLARNLRPDVRFLVFFSSVAGAFGSRGQADYAAANEVLNKLAVYLDSQWEGRVVAINWGPWEGLGMVTEEARRQFAARGVQMIAPVAGQRAFDQEIRLGRKGEVEVVLGDGPWEADRARWGAATSLAAHS
ncbi:MAG TPA: SDR family NAD(P)-dependent oxidoreductase, partial [Blastocatellia bacterium]|nr:SDR family NAD(P)-dependent oxidoreductase [Blastocatellia bacterium]